MRITVFSALLLTVVHSSVCGADYLTGSYVEARTCQVYTGPCFANGEVGSAGKNAIMTWGITEGQLHGVDLAGQSVFVVVKASHTLGFHGLDDAASKKAIIVISESASDRQAAVLKEFALARTGIVAAEVARLQRAAIDLDFDRRRLVAKLEVGDFARLETRQARKDDCICSNESAYYPPLTKLTGFVPGVTIEGDVKARGLGTRWSIPDSRTAYMGTFDFEGNELQVAERL